MAFINHIFNTSKISIHLLLFLTHPALLKMLCLGMEKSASFCGCHTSLRIFFKAEGKCFRAEGVTGRWKQGQDRACRRTVQEAPSTEHFPGKEIPSGNQRSCVGFAVAQAGMEICWPEALLEGGHCGTRETFVLSSFSLLHL